MNIKDTPASFKGYLYRGQVYYQRRPDTLDDGYPIFPHPMGKCIIETGNELEGFFECSVLPGKNMIDIKSPFERIK